MSAFEMKERYKGIMRFLCEDRSIGESDALYEACERASDEAEALAVEYKKLTGKEIV